MRGIANRHGCSPPPTRVARRSRRRQWVVCQEPARNHDECRSRRCCCRWTVSRDVQRWPRRPNCPYTMTTRLRVRSGKTRGGRTGSPLRPRTGCNRPRRRSTAAPGSRLAHRRDAAASQASRSGGPQLPGGSRRRPAAPEVRLSRGSPALRGFPDSARRVLEASTAAETVSRRIPDGGLEPGASRNDRRRRSAPRWARVVTASNRALISAVAGVRLIRQAARAIGGCRRGSWSDQPRRRPEPVHRPGWSGTPSRPCARGSNRRGRHPRTRRRR